MKKALWLTAAALLLCALTLPAFAVPPHYTTDRRLPNAMQGVYYSTRIKAVGSHPLTIFFEPADYTPHHVPKGLRLTEDGVLYGTPQETGDFEMVIVAKDSTEPSETVSVFKLLVKPFDESALRGGGSDANVIGAGFDDLTGVANAIHGGIAAMGKDILFFVDGKGYLMESHPPFRSAERSYGAVTYANLDTLGSNLYYYHHYLASRTPFYTMDGSRNTYVTRIVKDSIARKGRLTLVELKNAISSLSVTNEIVLYIDKDLMRRADINSGRVSTLRVYADGREVQASSVFPYNGFAYFMGKHDKRLYRAYLDGQIAEALTQTAVHSYTAALHQGMPVLYFTNPQGGLFRAQLDGSDAQQVEGIRAGVLNADDGYLYFTNLADGSKIYRMAQDSDMAEPITAGGARSIYVLPGYVAFEPPSGASLCVIPAGGGSEAKLRR